MRERRLIGGGFCRVILSKPLFSFILFGVLASELAALGIMLRMEGRLQSWTSSHGVHT